MVFPPEPAAAIDWNDIGFKTRDANGHVECHYSKATGKWSEPKFVRDPFLRIHGLAPGLNYGQQCYEGMKAHRCKDGQIRLFRVDKHAQRFRHSASFIEIPLPSEELFIEAVQLAVGMNADFVPPHETGASLYIRPLLFGSCAQLGLNPPEEYMFTVYVLPVGVYHGAHPIKALILENFDRAAPEGTGSAKIGGNYAPVLKHSEAARRDGFGITLHLDSKTRTYIEEFSTSGFIGIQHGDEANGTKTKFVIPESRSVIDSVTASSCAELARSFGWDVEIRPLPFDEINIFDEVIAAGTAAALVPIKSITLRSKDLTIDYLDADEPGPCYTQLITNFKGVQLGKLEDKWGWGQVVQEPAEKHRLTEEKIFNGTNGTH